MKSALRTASFIALLGFASSALADGPEVFKTQKCTECHSVKAAGITRTGSDADAPDLSKVGAQLDKKAIALFLLKKTEINGEKHKKLFGGTTDELKTVATWLETLK